MLMGVVMVRKMIMLMIDIIVILRTIHNIFLIPSFTKCSEILEKITETLLEFFALNKLS